MLAAAGLTSDVVLGPWLSLRTNLQSLVLALVLRVQSLILALEKLVVGSVYIKVKVKVPILIVERIGGRS